MSDSTALAAKLAITKVRLAVLKATFGSVNRFPAGSSKGGQFAPKGGAGVTAPQLGLGGNTFQETGWAGSGMWGKPKTPPPGAKPHPAKDDKGNPVSIDYPTPASPASTWGNPNAVATFTPGGKTPEVLNGVPFKPWTPPKEGWAAVKGTNEKLDQDFPFEPHPTKKTGAGVIIMEPDGRVWLTKPTNEFGGYKNTFPKGTAESGLTLQQNAIKEAYEETGLKVKIVGIAGDIERDTSKARFYIARRVGGTPRDMGWESQAMRLAPEKQAIDLLNKEHDKKFMASVFAEMRVGKAKSAGPTKADSTGKPGTWQYQERWPAGSSLGGQWKAMGADGITAPPKIAGGLEGTNSIYQKAANAAHDAAQSGDTIALNAVIDKYGPAALKYANNEKSSSHVKWGAQVHQYVTQAKADIKAKTNATATADKLSGPQKLSAMSYVGAKTDGSNPGGMYKDAEGQWLVKGSNAGVATLRSQNEVLASKLMLAVGSGAPEMKLVDMEGKYGGGLGVGSKWISGGSQIDLKNPAHLAAAQADFAVHAWLANYDVIGPDYANTKIIGGKAVNIDPGGALLYRAQGAPKGDTFGNVATEFDSLRKPVPGVPVNHAAHSVYGSMTASQIADSAEKLKAIDDAAIKKLVDTYGPGTQAEKDALTSKLIARKADILAKVAGMNPPAAAPAKKADDGDSLLSLFAISNGTAAAPAGSLGPKIDSAALVASLKAEAASAKASIDALNAKKYKDNKTVIEFTGDGPGNSPYKSIGAINAAKKKKAIAAHTATLNAVNGLLDKMGQLGGPEKVADIISSTLAEAKTWVANGSSNFGTVQATFEARILEKLGFKSKYGAITSNPLSNLLYNMAEGKPVEPPKPAAAAPTPPAAKPVRAAPVAAPAVAPTAPATPIEKPTKWPFEGKASYYNGLANSAEKLHAAGDLAGLKALSAPKNGILPWPAGSKNGQVMGAYHSALVADLEKKQAAQTMATVQAAQAAISQPAPVVPKVGTTAPGATGAMPDFAKFKLPSSNSNAASHNGKVDKIAEFASKGDIKGLLSLNFGTNTYGKQQVKLTNDALGALGSPFLVMAGQKANAHPALLGGYSPGTVAAAAATTKQPAPAAAPAPKPAKPTFKPEQLSTPPNFNTMKDGGPLSGVQAVNDSNNAAVQQVFKTAQAGELDALQKLTFEVVDKASGTKTGVFKSMSEHPSQHVRAYWQNLIDQIDLQLNPPKLPRLGQVVSGASLQEAAAKLKPVPHGKAIAAIPKNQKAGFYIINGQIDPALANVPANNSEVDQPSWKKNVQQHYANASAAAQQSFSVYVTSSGAKALNTDLRTGSDSSYGGKKVSQYVKDFEGLLVDIPVGTTFVRHMGGKGYGTTPPPKEEIVKLQQFLLNAQKGTVLQEPGFSSSSYTNAASVLSNNDIQWNFTAGPGVKAFPAWLSANVGEGESLFPPNTQYLIRSAKKVGKTVVVDAVLLPHDHPKP